MRRASGFELWAWVAQIKGQKYLAPGKNSLQSCPPLPGKAQVPGLPRTWGCPFCFGSLSSGPCPLSLALLASPRPRAAPGSQVPLEALGDQGGG